MSPKIFFSAFSGILGTMAMMFLMLVLPNIGLPKLNQPEALAMLLGGSETIGWGIYFIIGALFAIVYHYGLAHRLPISSNVVKGLIFGFMVFVITQALLLLLPLTGKTLPPAESPLAVVLLVNIFGHLIYGVVVAIIEHDADDEE